MSGQRGESMPVGVARVALLLLLLVPNALPESGPGNLRDIFNLNTAIPKVAIPHSLGDLAQLVLDGVIVPETKVKDSDGVEKTWNEIKHTLFNADELQVFDYAMYGPGEDKALLREYWREGRLLVSQEAAEAQSARLVGELAAVEAQIPQLVAEQDVAAAGREFKKAAGLQDDIDAMTRSAAKLTKELAAAQATEARLTEEAQARASERTAQLAEVAQVEAATAAALLQEQEAALIVAARTRVSVLRVRLENAKADRATLAHNARASAVTCAAEIKNGKKELEKHLLATYAEVTRLEEELEGVDGMARLLTAEQDKAAAARQFKKAAALQDDVDALPARKAALEAQVEKATQERNNLAVMGPKIALELKVAPSRRMADDALAVNAASIKVRDLREQLKGAELEQKKLTRAVRKRARDLAAGLIEPATSIASLDASPATTGGQTEEQMAIGTGGAAAVLGPEELLAISAGEVLVSALVEVTSPFSGCDGTNDYAPRVGMNCDLCQYTPNVNYSTYSSGGSSVDSCMAGCDGKANCTGFRFHDNAESCYLWYNGACSGPLSKAWRPLADVTTYVRCAKPAAEIATLALLQATEPIGWRILRGKGCEIDGDCVHDGVGNYSNNDGCVFEFGGLATVVREEWDVEDSPDCKHDWMQVREQEYGSRHTNTLCGGTNHSRAMQSITTVSGHTVYTWVTDGVGDDLHTGWRLCTVPSPPEEEPPKEMQAESLLAIIPQRGWIIQSACSDKFGSQVAVSDDGLCVAAGKGIRNKRLKNQVHYSEFADCQFRYVGTGVLKRVLWDVEKHDNCSYDWMTVRANGGHPLSGGHLHKLCGNTKDPSAFPSQVEVYGNTDFRWKTDSNHNYPGWRICVEVKGKQASKKAPTKTKKKKKARRDMYSRARRQTYRFLYGARRRLYTLRHRSTWMRLLAWGVAGVALFAMNTYTRKKARRRSLKPKPGAPGSPARVKKAA